MSISGGSWRGASHLAKERLQLWGGVECTVNRVGETYFEQLDRLGHSSRIADLDAFARIGISALRQPVLWERVAPEGIGSADWQWTDSWLARLQDLHIRPIVGLLHHGSGPRCTSLIDPQFPEKLEAYARAVAERYPWVEAFTPINEPVTTARFSGLYGHWYPHSRDDRSFLTALLNECRATVLAMRAIRCVNPRAQLVQTDDLYRNFATPRLQYQADFENERRWLGYDLLCGRVDESHPLFGFLRMHRISTASIEWFRENPCPPDIIGVNHYLTSDRFLDEDVERYPPETRGGNGRDQYADVVAARVRAEGPPTITSLLGETWERYHIPLALTEVHNGCTREEQLRWLLEVWRGACDAREAGIDVVALTLWSLLGAFDWDSLVTRDQGRYEPGVFDIRGPSPRPTAVAKLAASLAGGVEPQHPLLDDPGWWRRPQRFQYGHSISDDGVRSQNTEAFAFSGSSPLLIAGGRGTLGRAVARICATRGIAHLLLLRPEMDISDRESVVRAIAKFRPWAIVNAAGYVRVDDAESDWDRCYRENVLGPEILASECRRSNVRLVTFSSDLVFDGAKGAAYVETDSARPLGRYGHSKMLAEQRVLDIMPESLVVRTSAFFGPWDDYNFLTATLRAIALNQRVRAAADTVVSPTYIPDLVHATLDSLIDGEHGIWHLANRGETSWAEFAMCGADQAGLPRNLVEPCLLRDLKLAAERPLRSPLHSEKCGVMPTLEDALARFVQDSGIRKVNVPQTVS